MTEEEREASTPPEPERYYAQYVQLPTEEEGAALVALQEEINTGTRQSWRLLSVMQDPTSREGVFIVWDTTGFFSG